MGLVGDNGSSKKVYYAAVTVLGKKFKLCFVDTGGLVVCLNQNSLQQLASTVPLFISWKQEAEMQIHTRRGSVNNDEVLQFDDGTFAENRGIPASFSISEFCWVRVL